MVGGRIREGIEGGGVVGDGVVGCGGIPRGRRRGAEHCVTILAIVSFYPRLWEARDAECAVVEAEVVFAPRAEAAARK